MHLSEPLTTLTDYALGTASLYFGIHLLKTRPPKRRTIVLSTIGFFGAAIAAFVGGTFHALKFQVANSVLNALWNIAVFSIGAGGAFMVAAVMVSSIHRHHPSRPWLRRALGLTIAGFAVQQSGMPLHNDIFHCIQIVALYLFFSGARLLEDRLPPG